MLTDLYISYVDFLNKRSVFEKLFYISLILIILYCVLIYRSTVETMENRRSIGQFVSVYGNNIYDDYYANIYDELFLNKTKNDYEIDLIIKKTIPTFNSNFLVIGSGTGHYVGSLTNSGYKAEGLDLSQSMVNKSKQNYPESIFNKGDALESITFNQKTFSHIMCMYFTIYTIKNKRMFFQNCMSWLKSNGFLIIHLVDRDNFDILTDDEQPHKDSVKLIPTTTATIENHKYKSTFELNGDVATFTEIITDKRDKSVRNQVHTLYMPLKEDILKMAKSCGFEIINKYELDEVSYKNHFIYILKKR